MAATLQLTYYGGQATEPTPGTNVDKNSGGVTVELNLADSVSDTTTPVQIPTATGTNYSWYKLLGLQVTATAGTSISNRKVSLSAAPASGLFVFFLNQPTYTEPSGANKPADNGTTNAAVPTGYTQLSTTPQVWDATAHSAGATGRNGNFVQIVGGVDATYAGGPGASTALPDLVTNYDEA